MAKEINSKKEYDVTKFERPSVAVDTVVFTIINNDLKVLLIKRKEWPFKNLWAIPGGFIRMGESLDKAAKRELEEETGAKGVYLEQLYTFGKVKRDPRTRVLSVSYMALASKDKINLKAGTDAKQTSWHSMKKLPKLGFDHKEILEYALTRLRYKLEYTNVTYSLLPEEFTLTDMQKVYEIILDKKLDKRNFRKKISSLKILKSLGCKKTGEAHRPACLYTFKEKEPRIVEII